MKYLIISKGPSLSRDAGVNTLHKAHDALQQAMESGRIEACYGLIAGGTVFVVNAESHGTLARALRKLHLASAHDVEVYPIIDGLASVRAHIEHKSS